MSASNPLQEWGSGDELPKGFTEWLREVIGEQETEQRKYFPTIAREIGVSPSILSRWIGGMGPLDQNNVQSLASIFGPVVYTYLHIPRPDLS